MTLRRDLLIAAALLTTLGLAASACDGDPVPTDTGTMQDAAMTDTGPVSPCGATGPFGTYTISGGQSGVTACGQTFMSFTGATLTIEHGDGSNDALITVTGTGVGGDTMNCLATVNECMVTASGCTTAVGTIGFNLNTFTHQVSGTAMPYVSAQGGCAFTYSVEGTR